MPIPGVSAERYPEIAETLGITVPHVWDLATSADEVASTLSLHQVHQLSSITGLGFATLIGFEASDAPPATTPEAFCAAVRNHASESYAEISAFEEVAGWGVEEFLEHPGRLYETVNWNCLRDLASHVGIDPVSVLPPEAPQGEKHGPATA